MIDLLARVVPVSVETVAITEAMKALDRTGWAEGGIAGRRGCFALRLCAFA